MDEQTTSKEDVVKNAFGDIQNSIAGDAPDYDYKDYVLERMPEETASFSGTSYKVPHVHGPDCGHHIETGVPSVVKYATPGDVPDLDVAATFATNEGPNWAANTRKAVERITARIKDVPEGDVIVLFVNQAFYSWLISYNGVLRTLRPSRPSQVTSSGIMGMWGDRCIVVCDLPMKLQLTANKAFYFCKPVLLESEG